MRFSSTAVLLSGLAAQQAVATWDVHAPGYSNPKNTDNECSDKQKGGYNWGDVTPGGKPGSFSGYDGFNFKGGQGGWSCQNSFGKRDQLTKRTFGGKCIKNTITPQQPASFDCGDKKGFSVTEFQVSVEYDTDVEFHYKMPDGSTCKQTAPCKKDGYTVKNTQCGGAKGVDVYLPKGKGGNNGKGSCEIGFHSIGFECNPGYGGKTSTPSKPGYTAPPSKSSETPGQPGYTPPGKPSETPSKPSESKPGYTPPGKPSETPSKPSETPSKPGYTPPGKPSETPNKPSETPNKPSETPNKPSETPGKPSESSPSKPSETPSKPGYTPPGKPSETPNKPSETPGKPSESSPSKPSETPGKPSETQPGYTPPGKPSETPSKPSETPNKPSETPGKPSESSPGKPSESSPSKPSETPSKPSSPVYSAPQSSAAPTAPGSPGYTPPATPPTGPGCPNSVPKCINTWLELKSECKDNTDYSCYCKNSEFTKEVIDCVSAWAGEEVQAALSYLVGICAQYVPQNPGIITNCPGSITLGQPPATPAPPAGTPSAPAPSGAAPSSSAKPVETITPAPSAPATPVTTIIYQTTVTVPCSSAGTVVPGSSTVTTISTQVTVPQVVFTTAPPAPGAPSSSAPVNLIPGTPAPVPAQPTGIYPSSINTIVVPSGNRTTATAAPSQFTGAASSVSVSAVSYSFMGALLAFFAL